MRLASSIRTLMLTFVIVALVENAEAQGKGGGQGKDGDKGKSEQARGRDNRGSQARPDRQDPKAASSQKIVVGRKNRVGIRGEAAGEVVGSRPGPAGRGRFVRQLSVVDIKPKARKFVNSNRFSERVAGGALAHAFARGINEDALVVTPKGRVVFVRNRGGDVLLDIDDDRARTLGAWKVVPLADEVREGSPSFCRSGAGHPVWGRQWCLDKGFGLGASDDFRWGRAVDPRDIIFRDEIAVRTDPASALTREVLRRVLGDEAFNRLAVHAITLGLVEPLTGVWLGESTGPRVLLVRSGDAPIAEVVDVNRDARVDALYVTLLPW